MGASEDSMKKLKRKKNKEKKREGDSDMGISQRANSYRVSKEDKKKKNKSSADNKLDANILEPHIIKDETLEISEGKKKSRKSRDKKRKKSVTANAGIEEFDASHSDIVQDGISGGENAPTEQAEDKLKKSRKKKRKNVELVNKVDECNEKDGASQQKDDFAPEDHISNPGEVKNNDASRISKTGKSKKPGKMKKKQLVANDLSSDNLLEKRGKDAEDEVYQLSSGDEDYSTGMKKWVTEYYESRPGIKVLQERIDDFIMAHEAKEQQARAEREAQAAEGGWTVVVHQKGRKKTTDAESGIAVGSVAQAAVVDKMEKKKKKDVGLDFYRFQKKEAHRNEIMMLQSKFEQDKKRIQQMRAARKFRPY